MVEAGLGRGHRDFRTMRLHTLPGSRPAAEIWNAAPTGETVEDRPAYARLMAEGTLDRCGMTLLAGKAVGAPFVGAAAATLALSEILRLLHGGGVHQMIDLDLLSLDQRVASHHQQDFSHLNPGFTASMLPSSRGRSSLSISSSDGLGGPRNGFRAGRRGSTTHFASGSGNTTPREQAASALEERVERDKLNRAAIRASVERYAGAGPRLRRVWQGWTQVTAGRCRWCCRKPSTTSVASHDMVTEESKHERDQ